ncbi:hypothetical protein EWI61_14495 [Methylolobus aquaticus]|nr:hypothetical protein EWI61_14495 [Methylolobus aquaticus]
MLERLYDAAARAGLLSLATWLPEGGADPETAWVEFRAPDEMVLDGLGLSTEYTMRYPASAFVALASGDLVTINGERYRVRDIRAIGDGSERRASLTRLSADRNESAA